LECPNKRIMMIRDNGDIESESDRYDCEGMPPLEDSDGDELALLVEESLVIRRTLQVQVKEDETSQQRENMFSFVRVAMYKPRCVDEQLSP